MISARADRTQRRTVHFEFCVAVTAVGLILLIALAKFNQPGAKYFATFVLAAGSLSVSSPFHSLIWPITDGFSPAYACSYPWLAGLMPRPASKRAVAVGIANSLSNIGAFSSGYIYYAQFGPNYLVSWSITLGFCIYVAFAVAFLWYMVGKRNVHLDMVQSRFDAGEISESQLERMEPDEQMAAKSGFRLVR